jgi:hypothetical protein
LLIEERSTLILAYKLAVKVPSFFVAAEDDEEAPQAEVVMEADAAERSLEELLAEEEEERKEMESYPPEEFVDLEDEEEGEEEEELIASTSAGSRKPRAAAGSKGPTLAQQLQAIKLILATKEAELSAANALLAHNPSKIRDSLPNPDVRVVAPDEEMRGHNSDGGLSFGRHETAAETQIKVTAVFNSEEQRQLREERAAPKDKVCSTRGCNTILLPSGPMASKKCPACRGGRPPVAPSPAVPKTSAAAKASAALGLKGGVKKR